MNQVPPTDDREWYERRTVRTRGEDSVVESHTWRCYPLGWNIGLVCDVDAVSFEWYARWRNRLSTSDGRGQSGSLEEAKLLACEAAETLLDKALDELEQQNIDRRAKRGTP